MKAKIITYCMAHRSAKIRSKLNRELNGYTDVSHGGKYKYRRQGLLGGIIHKKPARNTIIAANEPARMIIKLLQEFNAKIDTIDIRIELSKLQK